MPTFDARHVDEPRRAADEGAAGEDEFRTDRQPPSVIALAPNEIRCPPWNRGAIIGCVLKTLKFVEWGERRIPIVQVNHETNGDEAVFEMIDKRAAAGAIIERPAEGMLDEARPVQGGIDPPKLF